MEEEPGQCRHRLQGLRRSSRHRELRRPGLRFGLPDHLTTPGPANGPANLRWSGKWSRAPCRDWRGQAWAVRQAVRQTICMYLYVGPPKNFACGATNPGGQPPGPPVVRQASQTPNRSPVQCPSMMTGARVRGGSESDRRPNFEYTSSPTKRVLFRYSIGILCCCGVIFGSCVNAAEEGIPWVSSRFSHQIDDSDHLDGSSQRSHPSSYFTPELFPSLPTPLLGP